MLWSVISVNNSDYTRLYSLTAVNDSTYSCFLAVIGEYIAVISVYIDRKAWNIALGKCQPSTLECER